MSESSPPSKPSKSMEKKTGSELPRRFGRLTLLRQLARGGMGEVFLAAAGTIDGAERPCVVKIIRREHSDDKSFLARFLDEARIQAQLHHPGVAQILEANQDEEGKPFVVVEHVEGRNLGEVRTRAGQLSSRVSWPEAVAIGIAMAEALAHVHERTDAAGRPLEIVHRDLSPQNAMVSYGGDVKLIDFGTARGENRRCHTVAGIVFAKPGYVAPEVANHTPGGIPADIYAFGIMLWELLAGRRFLSGDASEHLAAVAEGRRSPTPIAQLVDAPGELDAVIHKLTATAIEERYGSARDAMNDLLALLKRAPSLPDGERGVRRRISLLMQRLYPSEPARTRTEFARLVAMAKKAPKPRPLLVPSPSVPRVDEEDPSLLPGTRYRLLRELGKGAMGVVHEAVHVDLGRSFALKVLPNDSASIAAAERLRSEARVIARLSHENLVTLHDFGFAADGRPFYVMERLEGESLDQRLGRDGALPWKQALRIGVDACRALAAAHAADVVHRDIKPANLFLTKSGDVKLLDFGVAKAITNVDGVARGDALSLVGTPDYMAPEQLRGGTTGEPRTDLYQLGVVLYELLTGRLPHVEATLVALIEAKNQSPVEPPSERAKQRGFSKMVDQTILRALDKDPEKRFESADEMRAALEAALREPDMLRRRRRRIGIAAVLTLTVGLGGGIAYAAQKPDVRSRAMAMAAPLIQKFKAPPPGDEAAAAIAAAPAAAADEAEAAQPAAEPEVDEPTPSATAPEEGSGESAEPGADPENAVAKANEEGSESESGAESESGSEAEPAAALADEAEAKAPAAPAAELFAAAPAADSKASDDVESKIQEAQDLMTNGQKVKGFNQLRRLGRNHRKDARVLKAWCEAAIQMRGWGEAHRVARQWASVESTPESRMQLARMQRAVGKREAAIQTLNALLTERPGHEEARHMLRSLTGTDTQLARR
ncbi:MAG: protein kinase [Polyangiaceae bacterium]